MGDEAIRLGARRALERVLARVEQHLAIQSELALYHATTAVAVDRAYNSNSGAAYAALVARHTAELAHEVFALRDVLDALPWELD